VHRQLTEYPVHSCILGSSLWVLDVCICAFQPAFWVVLVVCDMLYKLLVSNTSSEGGGIKERMKLAQILRYFNRFLYLYNITVLYLYMCPMSSLGNDFHIWIS
jgi:hypothetical protein